MPDDEMVDIVLCGITVPTGTPPPSKVAADPNIVDGAVPMVEHTVLPIAPVEQRRVPDDEIRTCFASIRHG